MVKEWKKSGRNKVLAATLLGVGILVVLGAITVLVFLSGAENQLPQTPHREHEKPQASALGTKTAPSALEKPSITNPAQHTSTRKVEESPPTKPVRQTPLHIESIDEFDTHVLDAGGICLVDLFSNRCLPCRILAPKISSLAKKYAGKVTVCKVNVDRVPAAARRYGIQAIPTVLIIKNGKVVERLVGLRREDEYVGILEKLLDDAKR